MFNFFKKKTFDIESVNGLMARNDKFYFDTNCNIVRTKGISIFGPLQNLTFKSVEVGGEDYKLEESIAKGGYKIGDEIFWKMPFTEIEREMLVYKINSKTSICEETIQDAIAKYEHNKKYVFNPTLGTQKRGLTWYFFICLRPTDIDPYFEFLDQQGATEYIVEYRKYVLKAFQNNSDDGKYQFDMVVTVEPYLTWLDQNKEKLDEEKHRKEENEKCKDIFDMIRRA